MFKYSFPGKLDLLQGTFNNEGFMTQGMWSTFPSFEDPVETDFGDYSFPRNHETFMTIQEKYQDKEDE